jgi:DNA repair protein RadC
MRIATAGDAAAILAPYFDGAVEERVAVLHLDAESHLIGVTHELTGGTDAVPMPIRTVLGSALRLGAEAIVVAHNHPSGDPTPSAADVEATRRLAEGCRALAIRLVDHLIFAGAEPRSMAALGLL